MESWSSWWSSQSWPWHDFFEGLSRSITFLLSALWILVHRQLTPLQSAGSSRREQEAEASCLNRKCAQQALDLVLSLKGYYIKAAQTLCGSGVFPEEFEDVFAILLDQCPKEPFNVIRGIVEDELGCRLEEAFQDFEHEAVAAASIGQVHFASLWDGTRVAVKVQFPEVERYFRMDVRAVAFVMWLQGIGGRVKDIFDHVEMQMESEFDYTKEAAFMRECAENVMPEYHKKVAIPLPIDAEHPCFTQGRGGALSLCTRKVLTMERLEGSPIRVRNLELLEAFARKHGTTSQELKKQMLKTDPAQVDLSNKAIREALAMGEASDCMIRTVILAVTFHNCTARLLHSYSCLCLAGAQKRALTQIAVPLNGPRLSRLLFEVHGYEIFHCGLFNSDPHAGNVLVMDDGRLGLLDYGAATRLTTEQRTCLAKLVLAIADEDDDAVADAFFACGFRTQKSDPRLALLLAHVFFNRGPFPLDMNRIAPKVGMPQDADIGTLDQYIRGGQLDTIEEFPGHLIMFQRCCMVLSGIGMELGAGRLSAAGLFRQQAAKWLELQRRPAEDEAGASASVAAQR